MLKIKNRMHFETAEEIVSEILDKLQKYAAEAESIYRGAETPEKKLSRLEYLQTRYASLSDFLTNELGYDIRLEDGMLFTQYYFNRIFYYRQAAEIETMKKTEAEK